MSATEYLESLLNEKPALAETLGKLRDSYQKRHWHQLTETLLEAVFGEGDAFAQVDMYELYNGFVKHFESKMRPTSLVKFAATVANRGICKTNPPTKEEFEKATVLLDSFIDSDSKKKYMGEGACAYLSHERLSLQVRCGGETLPGVSEFKNVKCKKGSNREPHPSLERARLACKTPKHAPRASAPNPDP